MKEVCPPVSRRGGGNPKVPQVALVSPVVSCLSSAGQVPDNFFNDIPLFPFGYQVLSVTRQEPADRHGGDVIVHIQEKGSPDAGESGTGPVVPSAGGDQACLSDSLSTFEGGVAVSRTLPL